MDRIDKIVAGLKEDEANPYLHECGLPEHHLDVRARNAAPGECWCGGAGGRGRRYTVDGDLVAFAHYCSCQAGQDLREAIRRIRQEVADRKADDRVKVLWRVSGIPKRYASWTLESSPVMSVAKSLEEKFEKDRWLFICGPLGTGKTGLAVGYARLWMQKTRGEENVKFIDVPSMSLDVKGEYDSASSSREMLRRYWQCGFLVLDDLGAEYTRNSDWLQEVLWRIIGKRYCGELPTVITSNYSLAELAAPERCGPRLADRIAECCGKDGVVVVKGKS